MANDDYNSEEYRKALSNYWQRMCGFSSSSINQSFKDGEEPSRVHDHSYPTPEPLIPGPAAPIQVALRRRKKNRVNLAASEAQTEPNTQQYIANVLAEPTPFDGDFNETNWTSTIAYITKEGYMITEREDAIWTCINVINNTRRNWAKIDKMVCMIKSFTQNGLGDAMVTLKDPTGTIDASIHHTVLQNDKYAHSIGVGAVLILNKVTVTTFMTTVKYLNIFAKNLRGVVGKNEIFPSTAEEADEEEENFMVSSIVPDSEDEM